MEKAMPKNHWINWILHTIMMCHIPLALLALLMLLAQDAIRFFMILFIALLMDSTAAMIKKVSKAEADVPGMDTDRLQAISDYILYAFMPAAGLVFFGVIPIGLSWLAVLPLLSGAFRLSKTHTEWNTNLTWAITLFYLYALPVSLGVSIVVLLLITGICLFVEIKPTLWNNPKTAVVALMWMMVALTLLRNPHAASYQQITWYSLLYFLSIIALSRVSQLSAKKLSPESGQAAEAS